MTNALYRSSTFYLVPARPYQPARPGYTVVERVNVRAQVLSLPGGGTRTIYVELTTGRVIDLPSNSSIEYNAIAGFYTVTMPVFYPGTPEVPGTPAMRIESPPLGWTSFARSIAQTEGPGGTLGFRVPSSVTGAALGWATQPPGRAGVNHIRHGLLFTGGVARSLRTGANYGAYASTDAFTIAVRNGVITFKRGDTVLGTEAGTFTPGENLHLAASFYGPGDMVDAPSIVSDGGGISNAVLPGIRVLSAEAAHGESFAELPGLAARSGMISRSVARLQGLAAQSSDRAVATSRAVLSQLDADSYGGTLAVVPKSVSIAGLQPMHAASLLLVGETGTSEAILPRLWARSSDRPYAESTAVLPGLAALSYKDPPGPVNVLDFIGLDVPISVIKVDTFELEVAIGLDVPMTVDRVDVERMEIAFGLDVPISVTVVEVVSMPIAFGLDVPIEVPGLGLEVHAVNMDGFGSTAYSGFPFTSFARIGDRYFGTKHDGLYELGGDTDAGSPIGAAFSPGKLDFGSSQEKTVGEVFIGAASRRPMRMKLAGDHRAYLYDAESCSSDLRQHRFKLGKGLKANYLSPVFYNVDGADFEVDSLEFSVATLSRKT